MNTGIIFLPRFLAVLAVGVVFGWATQLGATEVLVPKGAGWRYFDQGLNQGTDWKELWFNEDAWGFGHGELGYGDAADGRPERTVLTIGSAPFNSYPTYYFRRFFYVADPGLLTNVIVKLLRDDGGIVYINGVEVFRSGMPEGPVDFETPALVPGAEGAAETRYFPQSVSPALLTSGINLIAVEVHQVDPESLDLSFDLELVGNPDPELDTATIVRGPYLQLLSTSTVTIRWRTAEETGSRVRYGSGPEGLVHEVVDDDPSTEHQITLTDLQPDTRYEYAIGNTRVIVASGPEYFFVTAPMSGKPTRIWAIGDSGTGSAQARAVFDRYRELTGNRYTDVWLMLGDNAYGIGTDAEYQAAVFDMYPELLRQTAVWSTMGNHETYSFDPNGVHAYLNIFSWPTAGQIGGEPSGTERYYSFDYGNIHFVCLDSEESGRTPGNPMLNWLEEDLAGNNKDWLIVFWHSPPYTKGSHDSDNPIDSAGNMIQMRENVVPILERYGADLVLCGHSHNYERSYLMNGHYGYSTSLEESMIVDHGSGQQGDSGPYLKAETGPAPNQGTVYVVAGSSGWATFQVGRHPIMHASLLRMGSLVLDVNEHQLDARFLRETGSVDDSFTIIKGAVPEPIRLTSLRIVEGRVNAQWKSRPGRTYMVEKTASLNNPVWTPASPEVLATGATTSWTDLANQVVGDCFFRVWELR